MKRLFTFTSILFCLSLGTVMVSGARTSWTIHRDNGRLQTMVLPAFPPIASGRRILILSPHPDDETLGCGGLIRSARERGIPVTIAIVTNGDAYPMAVQRAYRKIRPRPADYIRFGKLRQTETREALGRLGVPPDRIVFLGFPDRGLAPLWMSFWDARHPYTSILSRCSSDPYPQTFEPGAPYTGVSLRDELGRLLVQIKPTDLFFTHPNDDHPDHAYLSCFVLSALQKLNIPISGEPTERFANGKRAIGGIRLHTFLVHHGDWPVPQGFRPDEHLPPPGALSQLDTHWRAFNLTPAEIDAKGRAIKAYDSQLHVPPGARFLYSFIRKNELFGDYQFILAANPDREGPRASTPWLLSPDPIDDKFSRAFEPSADIEEVGVSRQGGDLRIRVATRGRLSRWVRYRVNVHRLDARDPARLAEISVTLSPARPSGNPRIACSWEPNSLTVRIPLWLLGSPTRVMASAETVVGGMVVDRSAWRGYLVD